MSRKIDSMMDKKVESSTMLTHCELETCCAIARQITNRSCMFRAYIEKRCVRRRKHDVGIALEACHECSLGGRCCMRRSVTSFKTEEKPHPA